MSAAPNAVTILTTLGPLATKRVTMGEGGVEIAGYGRAKHFSAREVVFDGLDGLHALLLRQDRRSRQFAVRAALREGIDPHRVRRTLHADTSTGEAPYFVDAPRTWAAYDFDSVPAPDCMDPAREPVEAGMFLRDLLPDPHPETGCVVQATSGCGFKPGLRYRLWFVLSRPMLGRDIERWCACPALDPVTLFPIEPIYLSRPVIEGMPDPVPRRIVRLDGLEEVVAVPDPLPASPTPGRGLGGEAARAAVGFDGWLARIGDGEGLCGFRQPIMSALAAYARRHGGEALERSAGTLRARIAGAVAVAPRRRGREPEIERYLGEAHFGEMVGWLAGQERARDAAARAGAILAAALTGRVA